MEKQISKINHVVMYRTKDYPSKYSDSLHYEYHLQGTKESGYKMVKYQVYVTKDVVVKTRRIKEWKAIDNGFEADTPDWIVPYYNEARRTLMHENQW